jgi:hypothetical protein
LTREHRWPDWSDTVANTNAAGYVARNAIPFKTPHEAASRLSASDLAGDVDRRPPIAVGGDDVAQALAVELHQLALGVVEELDHLLLQPARVVDIQQP